MTATDTTSRPTVPRVAVVQDGARLHYAVPEALHGAGALAAVYTDWYVGRGPVGRVLRAAARRLGSAGLARAAERSSDVLPRRVVHAHPATLLRHRRRTRAAGDATVTPEQLWELQAADVGRWLSRRDWGGVDAVVGFVRNLDPAFCRDVRARGVAVVADQMIAPAVVEGAEAELQSARWPGWARPGHRPDFGRLDEIERQTWAAADRVTCASAYVRGGLVAAGVEAGRVAVVPYPISVARYEVADRSARGGPVTVGFVGGVGLRKGAPYFKRVADRLAGPNVRFEMVGGVDLSDAGRAELARAITLVGGVRRDAVAGWLDRFDLFYFPTTCEGSAGSVAEAMAAGLAVVTSPNAGSFVEDGVSGYVVPYDDVEAACDRIERLVADAGLRRDVGAAARAAAAANTVDRYGEHLLAVVGAAIDARRGGSTDGVMPGTLK